MNTESQYIEVAGIRVEVVRKAIRNLHLGVYPPAGRVRVAAPHGLGDEAVRMAVISRLGWIRRQQHRFDEQPRQSRREMVGGESHYVWGHRYRLRVIEEPSAPKVRLIGKRFIELRVRPGSGPSTRETVLNAWYRSELRTILPDLIAKWEPIVGVEVREWGVKRMKTKWGACNIAAGRIWINLELAKKSPMCLEYVLVHEMVHLLERHHTNHFRELMDRFMPRWRYFREELNREPLAHEEWGY